MNFLEIKQKLGFGFMRLPMVGEKVDVDHTQKMVDLFMEKGFNYFDTAHSYINSQSEVVLKKCLTSKYPRESYIIADKLSAWNFEKEEEIIPLFENQLETCGVDYFDFYLMHAQNKSHYEKYQKCNAYKIALDLKKQGKIRHFGISFHDTPEVLDKILSENPEVEFVQIQFNYLDFESESVQSRKVYEMCRKHNKPVFVMEPVKGGALAKLSDEADELFHKTGKSPAEYALRFAASFEGVELVLSGMSTLDMIEENTSLFLKLKPLDIEEAKILQKACNIIQNQDSISCTACNYCFEKCPKKIPISSIFSCYNIKKTFKNWSADFYYEIHTKDKDIDCIKCGLCEAVCPQKLKIRDLLDMAKDEFANREVE